MLLTDNPNGGLYSISTTCYFLDGSIEIEKFVHDKGKGYNISYKDVGITIRLYSGATILNTQALPKWQDAEIKAVAQEILSYHLSKCSLDTLAKWVKEQRDNATQEATYKTQTKIREALGM